MRALTLIVQTCKTIFNSIFPYLCIHCRTEISSGYLCHQCWAQIHPVTPPLCVKCGSMNVDAAMPSPQKYCADDKWHFDCHRTFGVYDGIARELVLNAKNHHCKATSRL